MIFKDDGKSFRFCMKGIKQAGHTVTTDNFFDTVTVVPKYGVDALRQRAETMQINVRLRDEEHVSQACTVCSK